VRGSLRRGCLVRTTQQVLGHNPLEILFRDAVPRAAVPLGREQREGRIDVTWLDNPTALRSLNLVVEVFVDVVDALHVVPRSVG
jgi:hypothetical protein